MRQPTCYCATDNGSSTQIFDLTLQCQHDLVVTDTYIFTAMAITTDVWALIFENLAGDTESLCNVGLVARVWRSISLPFLLQIVDVS